MNPEFFMNLAIQAAWFNQLDKNEGAR